MKMKKFISFLCAAALTVSSFAGLTITASAAAADTVAITPTVGSKTVTVKQEGTTATQGVLLHAVYTNGALTSVESRSIPATAEGDAPVEYTKAYYTAYASGTGSKILAWKSLQGMEPITVNIVEPPAAKTQVSTVADLTVAASNNNKAPATITATVAAKTGQTFTDTAAFTYAWTKDGVDSNTRGATIENAAAGTYTVTATYNGTGDYEGSLGPATITITAADETRTNLSDATVALDKQTATVGDTVTASVTIGNENTDITDSADLTYQWYKAGETPTAVQGATAKTYTTTEAGTFYVTVSAAQASTTYVGTNNSGNVVVSEPVQAESYVTSADGKIKAISLYGGSYNETSQADKTYKQLKEDGIVTPIETRNNVETTGGETTYAEGVLLADNTTITDSKVASGEAITVVEVDIADVLDKIATHRISLKFDALTTFNTFNSEIYVSKLTAPTELATLTYTSLKELTTSGETNIGWGGRYTDATAMAKVITADVAAAAEANETKLYYAIYTKTRENALSNFALTAEQLYTVTVDSNITGGTVTTDKATAVAGETVTVTVAATSGHTYTEDSLSVKDASNNAVATTPVEGQAGKYTFTMPASNATVTAGFTENTGTPSTLKYIFTTDGTANGKVAEETVFEDSSDYMVEDAKTIAVTSDYIKPYKTGAKKIYGSATNGTFRVYKYVSGLDNAITVDAADKEVLVTVADLGHDYYDYQDFDHNAWGKFTKDNSSGLKAGAEFQGNVLWCRGGGSAWSYTDGIDDSVVLTYEQAFTYGKDKTNPTIIKNAAGEEIVSYIYHIGSANNNGYMESVKIAGVEKITGTATGTDLVGASWFNSNSEATIGHVELTIDKNAKTATIVFKKGTETKLTLSGSIESLKDMKLASWANQGGMNSDNNVPAINDFGVYKYTAPTPAKVALTGVTLAAKTAATGGTDVADADITVGTVLTATIAPTNATGVTYEWYRGEDKIDGATGATYTVTEADQGKTIKVVAKDDSQTANIQATKAIPAAAQTKTAIGGTVAVKKGTETVKAAYVNDTLTADITAVTPSGATVSYQWQKQQGTGLGSSELVWTNLSDTGADTATYTPSSAGLYKVVVTGTGNYEGTVESASITVAARPTATVSAATLHDTRTTGAIADTDLATDYGVTENDGVITINATDLKQHQNGDTPETMGYWVGAKFKLTNVPATAKYYLSLTQPTGTIDYSERHAISEILDSGTEDEISIYQDAAGYVGTNKMVYFAVEGIDQVYTIDFTKVSLHKSIEVSPATLHDTRNESADAAVKAQAIADANLADSYSVTNTNGVIDINATNLKKHQNGDTSETMGYWVGAKFKLTNVPATARYYLSVTNPNGDIDYTSRDQLSKILDAGTTDEVSIYQDASDYVGTQKLVYFAVEGIDKLYTIDFRNVTRAFNITAASVADQYTFADVTPTSAAEKSTVNIEVTPAGNKALTGITVTKTGTNETVAVANGDQTGKYSFTMPSSDVTITANVSETSNLAPATLEISPTTATAKQGDTIYFTRTVKDSNNAVTSMNTVNWNVYTDAEKTTKATNSSIDTDGTLRIGKNEEAAKLYVVATHHTATNLSATAEVTVERNEGNVTLQFYKGDGTTPVGAGLEVQPVAQGYNLSSETEKAWTDSNGRASLNLNMNKTYNITVKNNDMVVATIDDFVPSTATEAQRTIHIPLAASTAESVQGVYDLSNKIKGDKVVITPDKVVLTAKYTPVDGEAADMTYDAENNELYFLMPEKGVSNVTLSYVETGDSFTKENVTPTIKVGGKAVKKISAGDEVTVELAGTNENKKYAVDYRYTGSVNNLVVNNRATQDSANENLFTFNVPENIPLGNNLKLFLTVRQQLTSAAITGDVVVGGTLTAVPQYTAADGTQTAVADTTGFTYEWWRFNDSEGTSGGVKLDCTDKTYTVAAGTANENIGKYIKVIATAPDTSDYYDTVSAVTETAIRNNIFNITNEVNNKRYTVDYPDDIKTDEGAVSTYGETVTFTVSPANDNYILSNGLPSVTKANNEPVTVTANGDGTYSFKMPASDVTIDPTDIVIPTTKWTAMDGVEADTYTLTASTDDSSEETKDDVVTTFTMKAGKKPAFTFDLDDEMDVPYYWTKGEITVSYDLKIDSEEAVDANGKWFMDLSIGNSQVAVDGNEGSDSARFGRMGGMGSTLYVAGGKSNTDADAKYAYTKANGLNTAGEWKTVTYKVDLDNKKVFAVGYDGEVHSVLMDEYEADKELKFNASELYLNLGMTSGIDSATTIKVKNVTVDYTAEPEPYKVSHRYDSDHSTFDRATAKAGDIVTVTAPNGYKFTTVTVPGSPEVTIADDRATATFIMPIQNAVVTAYCTEIRTINNKTPESGNDTNNGYISIDPASAVVGETVTVTVHPKTGYEVDHFNVYRANTTTLADLTEFTAPAEGSNVYTFTMPNENIDVNVTFKIKTFEIGVPVNGEGYTHKIRSGSITTNYITDSNHTVTYDTQIYYELTPAEGYRITRVEYYDKVYTPDPAEGEYALPTPDANGTYKFDSVVVRENISAPEVTAEKIPYKITYSNPANGSSTIKVNGSVWNVDQTAEVGDVIQIKPNPAQDYEVNTVAVAYTSDETKTIDLTQGTGDAAGTYTFTMPAAPVTIAVTFNAVPVQSEYTVTFDLNGGSVERTEGDTRENPTDPIVRTVDAGTEYHSRTDFPVPKLANHILIGWQDGDGNTSLAIDTTINSDRTFTAQWERVYTATITPPTNGTLQLYKATRSENEGSYTYTKGEALTEDALTTITEGTFLMAEATAAEGYQLKQFNVTSDPATTDLDGDDNTTYTFTMPAANVTVSAEFEELPSGTKTLTVDKTYVDFENDTVDSDHRSETTKTGYIKVSGNALVENGTAYNQNRVAAIASVDASKYLGKIKKATLKFNANTADGSTTLRYGTYETYISFANNEKINAKNVNELGGKATQPIDNLTGVDNTAKDYTFDLTKTVREDADGLITLYLATTAGRYVYINNISLDIEYDVLEDAAVKVNQVYNNGESNVAIPTTSEVADGANWVAGDSYTTNMAATAGTASHSRKIFANVIDQPSGDPKAKYIYASGAANNQVLTAGENVVNLLYTQYKYSTATFTATVNGTATEGIEIKLSGTPADGSTFAATTLTTGNDGTVSKDLLPGTYQYEVEATGTHTALAEQTLEIANDGGPDSVTIALDGVSQVLASVVIDDSALNTDILTTTLATKTVGKLVAIEKDSDGTAMATQGGVNWTSSDNEKVTIDENGNVAITNAATAGEYTITATAKNNNEIVATKQFTIVETGTENIVGLTENFENTTNIFGAQESTQLKVDGIYAYSSNLALFNHILTTAGGSANYTSTAPVTAETNKNIEVSFVKFNGYLSKGKTETTTLKNSEGEEIISLTYDINGCTWSSITIGGQTATNVTDSENPVAYDGKNTGQSRWGYVSNKSREQGANGWAGGGYGYQSDLSKNPVINLTIDASGNVTATITISYTGTSFGGKTLTVTGKLPEGAKADFATMTITCNETSNSDRISGTDNIVTKLVCVD